MRVEHRSQRVCSTPRAQTATSIKRHLLAARWLLTAALLVLCAQPSAAQAQTSALASEKVPASLLAVPARSWVVDTVANELYALHHKGSYLRYRMHIVDAKGDQVRDVIESRDGTVARLILRDGKPLTDQLDQA